ncbi:hypothetical protein [Micromonospora sp. NPDC005324]|uniref:hypothetical protein n=1 Tax=Micromonospora sp. NPDC005324 TaxID=3157033 RepID=UPI0033A2D7E9
MAKPIRSTRSRPRWQAKHRHPKQRDGQIEALRNLRVARRGAVDQRAETQRQMKALIVTAPDVLRARCAAWISRN